MNMHYTKKIKPQDLEACIVEPILTICIEGSSIFEITWKIQKMFRLPLITIKQYLFYLIDYELIRYEGHKQTFKTTDEGHNLRSLIDKEKIQENVDIDDIIITFEYEQIQKG